jgi:hypothetical protein
MKYFLHCAIAALLLGLVGQEGNADVTDRPKRGVPTQSEQLTLEGTHVHLAVSDLRGAIEWFETVWLIRPTLALPHLAIFPFGTMSLILDASEHDSAATLGFESKNCDADFVAVVARGAVSIEGPADRPWGVRSAYVRGPGGLKLEIEQPLAH